MKVLVFKTEEEAPAEADRLKAEFKPQLKALGFEVYSVPIEINGEWLVPVYTGGQLDCSEVDTSGVLKELPSD